MAQAALWVLVAILVGAVVGLALLSLAMLRQQGRLLLRLEELEGKLGPPEATEDSASQLVTQGLPVGTAAPDFRLPDLEGAEVALEDFRGQRVLLVHWHLNCGFCHQIADELGGLLGDLSRRGIAMVLLSYGDREANRHLFEAHGLECPILLQADGDAAEIFHGMGTPVAYLLDEEGRVAEPLAVGAIAVPDLARALAGGRRRLGSERDLSESRIERAGLKGGTPAPAFSVPTVHEGTLDLQEYRGRRVLLVFSDPHCGPCDALLPDLVRLDRVEPDNGLAIVMVSRGDMEENRQKAAEYRVKFPLGIQPGWKVSKQYGIFATPAAFLIDEEGVIVRDVAIGSIEILALARSALKKGGAESRILRLFRARREAEKGGVA